MYKLSSITLALLLLFSSCQFIDARKGDQKIARVHNKVLYKSDLEGLVFPGTNSADSTTIVDRYIQNWVKQNVFLHEAEANLSDNMIDIQQKVDDYRNSLLIFAYENHLLNERLDTVIADEVLLEYYEKHQNEFKLRNNIVQLNFVKIPVEAPNINQVRRFIVSDKAEDLKNLEEYCVNHAAGYFLDQESWFIFTDIMREIPINPSNHESYLRNNKFVELKDEYFRYFLYLRDYKLEGTTSPLIFQADNIKSIILNHRKQKLINQLRQEQYLNAVKASAFEVYKSNAY